MQLLLDELMLLAPSAPNVVLERAIKQGVRRAMRHSLVARDSSVAKGQKCQLEYLFNKPDCHTIVQVHEARVCDMPVGFSVVGANLALKLHNEPREGDKIEVTYSWTTQQDTCQIPAYMEQDYFDVSLAAAAAYLFALPGQEWTDAKEAVKHTAAYERECADLRARVFASFSRSKGRMRAPRFANHTSGSVPFGRDPYWRRW